MKIYGPYLCPDGRRRINIVNDDGKKTSMSYAKYLLEQHLGRKLNHPAETADHIDENPANDAIENLQVLSLSANAKKSAKQPEWFDFICPMCDQPARKRARYVRANRKQQKAGPFCGKSCAGKYTTGSLSQR